MSENQVPQSSGYGYDESEGPESSSFVFGLNSGNILLTKFEFTANGGKDGAEGEAIDIVFNIDGREKSARKFAVTKAFTKDPVTKAQIEVTDPAHPAFKLAQNELSAVMVHIVGCFVPKEKIKEALSIQIQSFKHYCHILSSLLPSNFATIKLDAFAQFQWQITGEASRTFLEFPKNMKHGRWLCVHVPPVGAWEKQQKLNAADSETALRYVDADGNVHPFTRNGWFMASNFAAMQKEAVSAGASQMNANSSTTTDSSAKW
jgi:hypothetical protein